MKFLDVEKYTPIQKSHEAYLKELMEYCKDTPRHPSYHIHPPCGLVNDPNGLAYFGGKYHVFYQWFPFGPEHGMKHWAHVISEDLIKWERSDQMLIPDQEYEKNGCYSGNSIEADGKLYLYYTANYKTEQGKILQELGFTEDIFFCGEIDSSAAVPCYRKEKEFGLILSK